MFAVHIGPLRLFIGSAGVRRCSFCGRKVRGRRRAQSEALCPSCANAMRNRNRGSDIASVALIGRNA